MKPKTKKSITKRFKFTKNGKILRRPCGQSHLKSKRSGDQKRSKRKLVNLHKTERKNIKKND